MARIRVTRAANPRKRRGVARVRVVRNARRRRRNARARHRKRTRVLSPKQVKFFGTAAQKAALRRARRRKRTVSATARATNPRRRRARVVNRRRRSVQRNPALVVTLGAVNPRRRNSSMARRRKHRKMNPRRRRTVGAVRRRRSNPTRVVVMAPRHRRHRSYRRRRNPNFSQIFNKSTATVVGGVLLGVAASKFLPTLVPASLSMGGSNVARIAITGVAAWGASMLAAKFGSAQLAEGVLYGGLAQTASVALNTFLPGFKIGTVPVALNGMGELMPGSFSVPQNPLRMAAPPAQARVQMNGLQRAFGTAL